MLNIYYYLNKYVIPFTKRKGILAKSFVALRGKELAIFPCTHLTLSHNYFYFYISFKKRHLSSYFLLGVCFGLSRIYPWFLNF